MIASRSKDGGGAGGGCGLVCVVVSADEASVEGGSPGV